MAEPRITNFGPYEGDRNAPRGSLEYRLWRDGYYDSRGNPHQPGNIALSPDQVRGARYGETVTRGGITGRFTDTTHQRLTNRVDVWNPQNPASNVPRSNPSYGSGSSLSNPSSRLSYPTAALPQDDEWTTSPGDRRFLPQVGPTLEINAGDISGSEWWRNEATATGVPSLEISAGGDSGSIWSGGTYLQDFGGDTSLGEDLSADLTSLGFGEDYTDRQTPAPSVEPELPGSPELTEPGLLPQEFELPFPIDDNFLPSTGEPTVQVPRSNSSSGGSDLNWMNGLSLGAYLGSPLSYPSSQLSYPSSPVQGGIVTYGGGGMDLTPGIPGQLVEERPSGPGHYEESAAGSTWVEGRGDRESSGEFNAWPRGELLSPPPPAGMTIVGHDTENGQPIYRDAQGNLHVNPGTGRPVGDMRHGIPTARDPGFNQGYGQSRSSAANLLQMWATGLHGPPNVGQDAPSPSAGHGFNTYGRLDAEGNYQETGRFPRNFRSLGHNYDRSLERTSIYAAGSPGDPGDSVPRK